MSTTYTFSPNFAIPYIPYFEINGVRMPQPSSFTWVGPKVLGMNGAGKNRYYPFWQCNLEWDSVSIDEYNALMNGYLGATTGYTVVFLPIIYIGQNNATATILNTGVPRVAEYFGVIVDMPILQTTIENIAQGGVKMSIRRINMVTFNLDPV